MAEVSPTRTVVYMKRIWALLGSVAVLAMGGSILYTLGGSNAGKSGEREGAVEGVVESENDEQSADNQDGNSLVPWIDTGKRGDPFKYATTPGAVEVYQYLRECYPDDKASAEDIWAQTPCFNERVAKLAETAEPGDFFAGAKAVVVERPDVFAVCHDAGHKGSDVLLRRYWDRDADIETQKRQLTEVFSVVNDTCMTGFVHGLFDTLGYLQAGVEQFQVALDACLSVGGFDCSDGMGHAAWEATQDLEQATELCTLLPTNEERILCDGGIVMRIYQHFEKTDPWYYGSIDTPGFKVEDWMNRVSQLCDTWPESPKRDKGGKQGCWAGVPYLYFKPLYSELTSKNNDFAAAKDNLQKYLRLMESACESFGPVGSEVCISAWWQYLVRTAMYEETNIKTLCGALKPQRSGTCVERAVAQLRDEVSRNQAVS